MTKDDLKTPEGRERFRDEFAAKRDAAHALLAQAMEALREVVTLVEGVGKREWPRMMSQTVASDLLDQAERLAPVFITDIYRQKVQTADLRAKELEDAVLTGTGVGRN